MTLIQHMTEIIPYYGNILLSAGSGSCIYLLWVSTLDTHSNLKGRSVLGILAQAVVKRVYKSIQSRTL